MSLQQSDELNEKELLLPFKQLIGEKQNWFIEGASGSLSDGPITVTFNPTKFSRSHCGLLEEVKLNGTANQLSPITNVPSSKSMGSHSPTKYDMKCKVAKNEFRLIR